MHLVDDYVYLIHSHASSKTPSASSSDIHRQNGAEGNLVGHKKKCFGNTKKTDLPDAVVIVAFYTLNQDSSQSLAIPIRMSTTNGTPFHHRPT